MHQVGEKIVYGAEGIMRIVDISDVEVAGCTKKYYVLESVERASAGRTYVPIDNERLTARMRPLLTREEILELLHGAKDAPGTEWSRDNRVRNERFKNIMESGDRARLLAMIRDIYAAGQKRISEGKKNYVSDENAMHRAERLLHSELAEVLSIDEADVPEFIKREIEK